MYDPRKSYVSPSAARTNLREKITLTRLASITAILIALSLCMAWPLAPQSSNRYSPWNNNQASFTKPGDPQPLGNSAPQITGTVQKSTGAVQPPDMPFDAFTLIVDDGLYADDQRALADDLKQALDYVAKRLGSPPAGHFNAVVARDENCNLHGIAYTEERTVQVSTCNDISRARAVAIMAHEFAHQLAQDRYGQAHLSADLILSEGVATWGAGEYWLGGQPDFRAFVRGQRDAEVFYPLATDYTGKGVGAMNALYYQWASFVDFLIVIYGREKFDHIYVTGQGAPGSADYRGVYGKALDVLEMEWQAWLNQ